MESCQRWQTELRSGGLWLKGNFFTYFTLSVDGWRSMIILVNSIGNLILIWFINIKTLFKCGILWILEFWPKNKSLNLSYRNMLKKAYVLLMEYDIPPIWLSLFWFFVGILAYIVSYIFLHISLAWGWVWKICKDNSLGEKKCRTRKCELYGQLLSCGTIFLFTL
jgi:hypothetical protein